MNSSMMQFEGVAGVFAVVAIVCLYIGYKLLADSSWLGGWVRGNIGIFFVLMTGGLALCVLDIRTYKPMFDDKTIATLSLRETSTMHYEVRLVDAVGVESRYVISGDKWYLTANQFRWSKRLSLGMGHGYRFTALTGKYNNTAMAATADTMSISRYLDVWRFLNSYAPDNFLVSTNIIVTTPEPLADAAMYEVVPSGFGLVVKPLNELAKRAQLASAPPAVQVQDASVGAVIATEPVKESITTPAVDKTAKPVIEAAPAAQEKPVTTQ